MQDLLEIELQCCTTLINYYQIKQVIKHYVYLLL